MKICLDARTINLKRMHGISRNAFELLKNFGKLDTENKFLIIHREMELPDIFKDFKN